MQYLAQNVDLIVAGAGIWNSDLLLLFINILHRNVSDFMIDGTCALSTLRHV